MLKEILQYKLKIVSKAILWRYKPEIIGVAGSIGKTSTKEAIYLVLQDRFKVYRSQKSFNNEIGLPLTILQAEAQNRNYLGWVRVILRGWWRVIKKDKNYPQILLLEMGVDKVGDMKYLTKIAKPWIGVISAIGPEHLENLHDVETVADENLDIVRNLSGRHGFAVLNVDELLLQRDVECVGTKISFGLSEHADVRAHSTEEVSEFIGCKMKLGVKAKITYLDQEIEAFFPNLVAKHQVYSMLAGMAVGVIYGMRLVDSLALLQAYVAPAGRMRAIEGMKQTLILDDSYNCSPVAARAALDTLSRFKLDKGARKIAVFGDMAEMGETSEQLHRELGEYIAKSGVDLLYVLGPWSKITASSTEENGLDPKSIMWFDNPVSVGQALRDILRPGDLILVKGSQNSSRLEICVKEIMAEPKQAKDLLCRQGPEWLAKEFKASSSSPV